MTATAQPWYPRPPILDRLPAGEHHVIEASAGTGKTFTIEHLVAERVLAGFDLARLLVVTFSERAAAELRARIRALLWALLAAAERPPAGAPTGPHWTLDDDARTRLRAALARVDVAPISTIHAFCQGLLTDDAFAHRRLFSQQLADGKTVFETVARRFLRTTIATDYVLRDVLRAQLQVAFDEDGSVAELIDDLRAVAQFRGGIEPAYDDAAMAAALAALPAALPTADDVLARYRGRKRKGTARPRLEEVLRAIEAARGSTGFARLAALSRAVPGKDPGKERAIDYVLDVVSATGDAALTAVVSLIANTVPDPEALLPVVCREPLRQAVRAYKDEHGLFDFDDMLELVARGLRAPEAAPLRQAVRARYDQVLVDEFQDTDPVQWEVFRLLFVDHDEPCRLSVIGDPKQAIYGFRAADIATYLGARAELLAEPDPARLEERLVRLTDNYRSSAAMIDGYNLLLEQGPGVVEPIFAADPRIQYGDAARVRCGDPSHRLQWADGTDVAPVRVLRVGSVTQMEHEVAAELERLLAPGAVTLFGKGAPPEGRALRPGDVYVLAFSRRQARRVADALGRRGIPTAFYKLDGLFETDEAGDLVDVLAAIAAPYDRAARARAWLTPLFELTPDDAAHATDLPDEHPLVRQLLTWHELARRRELRRLLGTLLDDSGVARRAALLPGLEPMVANLRKLLDLLAEHARRHTATLDDLVGLLRAWRAQRAAPERDDGDTQPLATERSAVQLMTMHASKGLEAPVVAWVGDSPTMRTPLRTFQRGGRRCGWVGAVPAHHKRAIEDERRGEHERLAYVVLTRARTRMVLPLKPNGSRAPQGLYQYLHKRLHHLADVGLDPRLFEDGPEPAAPPPPDEAARAAALQAWTPPPPPDEADRDARRALLRQRRGAVVTSYTQLAAKSPARAAVEVDRALFVSETNVAETPADQLVTSNEVGSFLHDALEGLDLAHAATLPDAAAFSADAATRAVVEPLADVAGIAPAQRPHAYRLLHAAVCRPIALGDAGVLPRIAGLPRVLRESEFAFPLPEDAHPRLGEPHPGGDRPFAVERGLVKGFIDVVFEHDGRVYFGDWKSSVLRDPSPAGLQRYVAAHFRWQIVVYGVAVLRMLQVRDEADYEARFGGVLYLFLREMEATPEGAPARGVWFERPSWEVARGWEETLRRHDLGGRGGGR